jgi:two-component system OmpR family sensor kinase
MSLRSRLTVLYTTLLGGVLLIFGALVYGLVSVIVLDQIDTSLNLASDNLLTALRIDASGLFDARSIVGVQLPENLLFQVWGNENTLQLTRPPGLQTPLDEAGRRAGRPLFSSTMKGATHLRVLSVPLRSERGPSGVLQVALNLHMVDIIQRSLAWVLLVLAVLVMVAAGLAAWLILGQALAPLATVTKTATQITRADDLSRRIPLSANPRDEVGRLIQAFNQTLERLDMLFNAQRRFLADVSHELRTPLTVIKGNVGLMRRLGGMDEESLSGIESEVDRLTRLVGDLLLLNQAESGRLPLDLRPVELDSVLVEVMKQMRLLAGERLTLRLAGIEPLRVTGDRDRLKQVMLNLVGNALQYTPPGGLVSVALRKSGNRVQFTVTDSGAGIPAQDLPHIFERFYRGEKSRKRGQGTGFGLGLSIAYWIVHHHGGTIEVASQEGKGTTFCVWLPLLTDTVPQTVGKASG